MQKILVIGGNGFIGREVCRLAARKGHVVLSLSRGGRPNRWQPWMPQVQWVAGDVTRPSTWRDAVKNCDAVIHCVGIVREHPEEGATFERINGEAAMLAAREAEDAGVGTFIFLSAERTPPFVSERFLIAKRRAEQFLRRSELQSVVLRPTYVYGRGRPPSLLLGRLHEGATHLPMLGSFARITRPLPVTQVAAAAVYAAAAPQVSGTYGTDGIERLATAYDPTLTLDDQRGLRSLIAAGVLTGGALGWAAWHRRRK